MDLEAFEASLEAEAPPSGLALPLQALWQEAKGDWKAAHRLAQAADGPEAAWVHAYLHRVEGDSSNAAYWYRRAGRPVAREAPEEEWKTIIRTLLREA